MAILHGFAVRCLFGVVFLHNAKQGKLLCAVLTHKSLQQQRLTAHRFATKEPILKARCVSYLFPSLNVLFVGNFYFSKGTL